MIGELLYGRTVFARLGLCGAVAPGWLALILYRNTLLKDIGLLPGWSYGGRDSSPSNGEDLQLETAALLARNMRCLPPAFWLAVSVSGSVSLQIVRDSSSRIVQSVLRTRFYVLVLLASAYVAKKLGREQLVSKLSTTLDALPAPVAAIVRTSMEKSQIAASALIAKVQEKVPRAEPAEEARQETVRGDLKNDNTAENVAVCSQEAVADVTGEFNGQVDDAIAHFTAQPNDLRIVRLKSQADQKWYQHPP